MTIIYAFLFSGSICLLAEVILNLSKLTPGHVTTLFSIIGAFLGFFGVYSKLIKTFHMGALMLISNFGNSLYNAGLTGYKENGIIGVFENMFSKSSLVISSTIIFSFIFACLFKSKD